MRPREWLVWALIAGLILARAVWIASLLLPLNRFVAEGHFVGNDALRYTEIAFAPGAPYRDHPVEIPPLEVMYLEIVASDDPTGTAAQNAFGQFILDILIAAGLVFGFRRGAALGYLLISMPLAPFLYFRLDLLSVALAVWALALVRHRRDAPAGVLLALAVLTKVWPFVLAAPLVATRRWRTLAWAVGTLVVGMLAWVAFGGWDAPMQVATFRRSSGWQIESVVGSVVLAASLLPVLFEQGANRVGEAKGWMRAGLLAALAGWLTAVTALARRQDDDEGADDAGTRMALAALAAVAGLLILAPILSWQYVAWLLPWMGILAARRRWGITALSVAVVALTTLLVFQGVPLTERAPFAVNLLLARNLALLALAGTALAGLLRASRTGSPEPSEPTETLDA